MQTGQISRRVAAAVIVLMTVVGLYVVIATPVNAAGSIVVSPSSGVAGDAFTISGSGFVSGEQLSMCFADRPCSNLGKTTAASSGAVSASVYVPADAATGAHVVSVCGSEGCSHANFTVLSAPTTTVASTTSSTTGDTIPPPTTVPGSVTTTSVASPTSTFLNDPGLPTPTIPVPTPSTVTSTSAPGSTTTTEAVPGEIGSGGGPPSSPGRPEPSDASSQPNLSPIAEQVSGEDYLGGADSPFPQSATLPAPTLPALQDSPDGESPVPANALAGPADLVTSFDPELLESRDDGLAINWAGVRYVALWLGGPVLAILIVIGIDEIRRTRLP